MLEFSDVFAKHRFDVGYNSQIQPKHDQTFFIQSPRTPIDLGEELQVERNLLQYFGIITGLNHSKYSSLVSAHRKLKLELWVNLIGIVLIVVIGKYAEYFAYCYTVTIITIFPFQRWWQTGRLIMQENLSCEFDCSSAYRCVQRADPLSVQLRAFNFVSSLASWLTQSITGSSAIVWNYFKACLPGNFCTQFMDSGRGVESTEQLIYTLRQICKCPVNCVFGSEKVSFLRNVITREGLQSENDKIERFLTTLELPRSVKQV